MQGHSKLLLAKHSRESTRVTTCNSAAWDSHRLLSTENNTCALLALQRTLHAHRQALKSATELILVTEEMPGHKLVEIMTQYPPTEMPADYQVHRT